MSTRRIAVLALIALAIGAGTAAADDAAVELDPTEPRLVDGYRNGRRARIKVVTVDWVEIEVKTAKALAAMRAAAATDGVELWVRSAFRDHERQTWLYQAWRAGWGNKAAKPGYSNHQSGTALDIELGPAGTLPWLVANGARFGFRNTVRGEPWHWEYSKRFVKKPPRARATARRRPRR